VCLQLFSFFSGRFLASRPPDLHQPLTFTASIITSLSQPFLETQDHGDEIGNQLQDLNRPIIGDWSVEVPQQQRVLGEVSYVESANRIPHI